MEGVIDIPPPPDPPFDIETFEPIEPPWQAIREWIPDDEAPAQADWFDQRSETGRPIEIPLEDGYVPAARGLSPNNPNPLPKEKIGTAEGMDMLSNNQTSA